MDIFKRFLEFVLRIIKIDKRLRALEHDCLIAEKKLALLMRVYTAQVQEGLKKDLHLVDENTDEN